MCKLFIVAMIPHRVDKKSQIIYSIGVHMNNQTHVKKQVA